jgi:5-methylcytosine-specific restriction endonuclease McrA
MKRPARKAIPRSVKDAVLKRQGDQCAECGDLFKGGDKIEYDHRPAIIMRAVNVEGTDYHPPQNDPDHIEALHKLCHLKRTVGRIPGAEKTITVKGSDAWLAAKFRKLEGKNKPKLKAKIANRGFPKTKRGFGK